MEAKKEKRVYRGIYLQPETDSRIQDVAQREQRSISQTVCILLESALKRQKKAPKKEATA